MEFDINLIVNQAVANLISNSPNKTLLMYFKGEDMVQRANYDLNNMVARSCPPLPDQLQPLSFLNFFTGFSFSSLCRQCTGYQYMKVITSLAHFAANSDVCTLHVT